MNFPAIICVLFFVCACSTQTSPSTNSKSDNSIKQQVDVLYVNGTIWTGAQQLPAAVALAVNDGVISFVSNKTDTLPNAQRTVDLQGRFLMPGLIDNHVHFLEGGAALAGVQLRNANTPQLFATRIANFAESVESGQWIMNGNWDHQLWGGELPHKDWIDQNTPDNPVFVIRLDGHMALANSAALELAGITDQTITPEGGQIIRDSNGHATGILKDNAMNLVFSALPRPTDQELLSAFMAAQEHALSLGLTEVHAVTANPTETFMLRAFRLAQDQQKMKIRAYVLSPIEHWQNLKDVINKDGRAHQRLRWGGVKGFVDGSLGSGTAWFHQPYSDAPATSGFALSDPKELHQKMLAADAAGLNLAIHAFGDKAIDVLIKSMHQVAGENIQQRRYRIEHFQHPDMYSITLAAKHGIIASMQPYHAIDDGRWAEKRIGTQRIKTTYAFRTLLDKGVILTFGSDWPVAPLSPFDGIYAAVTRRTTDDAHPDGWQPQEKISVEQALVAYTASNAYAGFEEQVAGTLEVGKRADLIILSDDPRTVDPNTLQSIRVLATIIDGETVYQSDDFE